MEKRSVFQLVVQQEGQPEKKIPLSYGEHVLGRSAECDILLQDPEISRKHARLEVLPGECWLIDLGSANGTQLEGLPLQPRHRMSLKVGQSFTIGQTTISIKESLESEAENVPAASVNPQVGVSQTQVRPVVAVEELETRTDGGVEDVKKSLLRLRVQRDGVQVSALILKNGEWVAGREGDCVLCFDDPFISRHHFKLTVLSDTVTVTDLGSRNGVEKDGQKIKANQAYPFKVGEVLKVGKLTFNLDSIPASAVTIERMIGEARPGGAPAPVGRPVAAAAPAAVDASKPLNLMGLDKVNIGRAPDNHVVIDHPLVSRYHACIERMGTRFQLHDLHSANGVYLNGERIEKEAWMKEGDAIKVGPFQFNFTGGSLNRQTEEGYTIDVIHLNKFVTPKLNLLQDISLNIGRNEFVALVGMSGAGKTTLQDAINGYRPATSGQVLVNGLDMYQNYSMFRNDIGYVPQKDIVHMELTPTMALDYVAQLRMPADTSAQERQAAIKRTLGDLDLTERKDIPISRLSGGQLKRVSIGVELLTRPPLFFLDEPTSGLDPGTEYEMMKLLRRLADQGRTIMIITHATKNVMLCDKVIILARGGFMAYYGAPEDALVYFDRFRTRREQLEKDMEFDDIYRILNDESKGTPADWGKRFKEEQTRKGIAPGPSPQPAARRPHAVSERVSALRQFLILSARNIKILTQDRVSLGLMLALAPVLGFMNFIWGRKIFDPVIGNTPKVISMWFMMAIIALLVGSLSSVREIVKETDIYKRERAVGLKIMPYVLSKLWLGAVVAIYQAAVLLFFVWLFVNPLTPKGGAAGAYFTFFVTIILGILTGYLLGLVISAGVPNQNAALIVLIAAVVPQFLFAGALLPLQTIPAGKIISHAIPTRWTFESFVRATGMGDQIKDDSCWNDLTKAERLALTEEEKIKQCNCMGPNIFTRCTQIPGILSPDFYDVEAKAALAASEPFKPVEPTKIPSPTAIASPTSLPSPTPYASPTPLTMQGQSMEDYQEEVADQNEEYADERAEQMDEYQDQIKDQSSDWADAQKDQFQQYAEDSREQFQVHANNMADYGDELAQWKRERGAAVGAAENTLTTIDERYGLAFRGPVASRWVVLFCQCLVMFGLILFFQKRKDVV